jgi:hypothetical protein
LQHNAIVTLTTQMKSVGDDHWPHVQENPLKMPALAPTLG